MKLNYVIWNLILLLLYKDQGNYSLNSCLGVSIASSSFQTYFTLNFRLSS